MVIVRLLGGLGNQMFQYAFGKNLSLIRNCELRVDRTILDSITSSSAITKRDYDLDIFDVEIKEFNLDVDIPSDRMKICKVSEVGFRYDSERFN